VIRATRPRYRRRLLFTPGSFLGEEIAIAVFNLKIETCRSINRAELSAARRPVYKLQLRVDDVAPMGRSGLSCV
jgi:hypothetical protein